MRKILIVLPLLLMFLACKKQEVSITGNGPESLEGTVYARFYLPDGNIKTDSITIQNGTFIFHEKLDIPSLVSIFYEKDYRRSCNLFVQNGEKVNIYFEDSDFSKGKVLGSKINDLFVEAQKEINDSLLGGVDGYIKRNPKSIYSPYFVVRELYQYSDYEKLNLVMDDFHKNGQKGHFMNYLENKLSSLERVQIGKPAPDFSLKDTNDIELRFIEVAKEKEYVLLDFWASWCPPCRRENPNLVLAYDKFHDKGFDIYAVSLDNDISKWKSAIHSDGLKWIHVSDLKGWESEIAKLYSINSIPSNLLVDKNGIIIGRNLHGEELDLTLSQLFE